MRKLSLLGSLVATSAGLMAQCAAPGAPTSISSTSPFQAGFYLGSPAAATPIITGSVLVDAAATINTYTLTGGPLAFTPPIGQLINVTGFANPANNGTKTVTARVSAALGPSTITVAEALVTEPAGPSVSISTVALSPDPGYNILFNAIINGPMPVQTIDINVYDNAVANPDQIGNTAPVNFWIEPLNASYVSVVNSANAPTGGGTIPGTPVGAGNWVMIGSGTLLIADGRSTVTFPSLTLPPGSYGCAIQIGLSQLAGTSTPTSTPNVGQRLHPLLQVPPVSPTVQDAFMRISTPNHQRVAFASGLGAAQGINIQIFYTPDFNAGVFTRYGTGCNFRPQSFREVFPAGSTMDITPGAMLFSNLGTNYLVSPSGAGYAAPTSGQININGTAPVAAQPIITADLTVDAAAGSNTYTLSTGSWLLTPAVSSSIDVSGFTNAANNGPKTVTAATANTITVSQVLATEAAGPAVTIATTAIAGTNGPFTAATSTGPGTATEWDDCLSVSMTLPTTGAWAAGFPFPGGSTTQVRISSNGCVFLSNTPTETFGFYDDTARFLNDRPRHCIAWGDLDCSQVIGGTLHYEIIPSAPDDYVQISWNQVPEWAGVPTGNPFNMQMRLYAGGNVEYIYGSTMSWTTGGAPALVGFSYGNGATDPGNSDISALLPTTFQTGDGTTPSVLTMSDRPVIGTSPNFVTTNIPGYCGFNLVVLAFTNMGGLGFDLGIFSMPSCSLWISSPPTFATAASLGSVGPFPGASVQPLVIPNNAIYNGTTLYVQAAQLVPPNLPQTNPAGIVVTNAVCMRVGLN